MCLQNCLKYITIGSDLQQIILNYVCESEAYEKCALEKLVFRS